MALVVKNIASHEKYDQEINQLFHRYFFQNPSQKQISVDFASLFSDELKTNNVLHQTLDLKAGWK